MQIAFDTNKDKVNIEKHSVSLAAASGFEWEDALSSMLTATKSAASSACAKPI